MGIVLGVSVVKVIVVLAVVVAILLNALGPNSSVGGSLTIMFASILLMWVIGLYLAWSKTFGVLGWLLSMITALVGGCIALAVFGMLMETFRFQRRLIDSQWSYVVSVAMMLCVVTGSWAPVEFGGRLMARRATAIS